jgi:hypothetical protein
MNDRTATLDLEVRNGTHPAEVLRISRQHPICIGRHASNDICIDDTDVAPIHCRVAWNGAEFEVAAANRDGVDVNGTLVRHSVIKAGDVLRIGPADLFVRSPPPDATAGVVAPDPQDDSLPVLESAERPVIPMSSGELQLAPLTQENLAAREGWDRSVFHANPWSGMGEHLKRDAAHKPKPSAQSPSAPPRHAKPGEALGSMLDEENQNPSEPVAVASPDSARAGQARPLSARLSDRLGPGRVRPGEQEALRSPVILAMFGIALALGLAAAAIYFVIGRETTTQEFDAASAEFEAKHYGQAAELFEKFLAQHNGHKLAPDAHYKMWNARILKEIEGGSPAWKRGLETVEQSIEANRDRRDFPEHNNDLVEHLKQIALGAAASAQSTADRSLLDISSSAESMLPRYFPDGKLPADLAARLRSAFVSAQDAIIKHDVVSAKIAEIERENAARRPMAALAARRALLARYPEASIDPKLAVLLKKTLDVEKGLVIREELNKPASPRSSANAPRMLSLTMHTRSRTEEPAGTRPVFVLAKDCCYAVDHVTGEPIWRRVIGLDSPFFPAQVETSAPGLLAFDSNHLALVLLDRRTGEPIWEQDLGEAVSGIPLIDQGQIYLATLGRHLYKIDLESGRISTRLTFSQMILSPPALTRNKERLIVAGEASLIYTLTTSPLECLRVDDLGHPSGSLINGAIGVGGLVLLTEANGAAVTRLRVFDAHTDETWLKPLDAQTVEGQVRDAPVVYGKMLFVSSVPARITAFTVSDTPGQEALTPTTSVAIPNQDANSIFLSAGPDGQLWMAGSSVRQLQLKLNSQTFSLNSAEVAVGASSQPLQIVGQYLFAARRFPYAGSVVFSEIDREPMTGQWRTIFGSSIIGSGVFRGGEIVTVGEAGEVFSISPLELDRAGFKSSATASVDPDSKTDHPLRATRLSDGKIAIESAGPKPTLWFIGPGGQITGSFALEKPLEAPPVQLVAGLVLPLPGRLRLISSASGVPAAEEQLAPLEGGQPARWKSVERISDKDLVALDSRGRLSRFQYRSDPVRSLAEVVSKKLEKPCDTGLVVAGTKIVFVDVEGELHILDAATLDPVAAHKLPSPAIGRLWTAGSLVLAETRDHQLAVFDTSGTTKPLFAMPLGETGPSGSPAIIRGRLVIATRDGTVLSVDPTDGKVAGRLTIAQPLTGGVINADGRPVVATIDGSLCRVDSLLETPNKKP